jgi:hypothetical protein
MAQESLGDIGPGASCCTISGFSTVKTVQAPMAVAVAIRCVCPAKQPSPKKPL